MFEGIFRNLGVLDSLRSELAWGLRLQLLWGLGFKIFGCNDLSVSRDRVALNLSPQSQNRYADTL